MTDSMPDPIKNILTKLATNAFPPLNPDYYADEAGYNDAAGDFDFQIEQATQAINNKMSKAKRQLLKDLIDCGEIHHSVYDYRLAQLTPIQSQTEQGEDNEL